jgi:hypothetical protein
MLPPVRVNDTPSAPYQPRELDFSVLVEMRQRHQTKQAALGVRTRLEPTTIAQSEYTLHQQVVRRLHEVLREYQDTPQFPSKVKSRNIRWESSGSQPKNGNSVNAAAAASAATKKLATRRRSLFAKAKVPCFSQVAEAGVSVIHPLKVGSYGVVFTQWGLMLGHVIALYSKGGGTHGKHGSVAEVSNISAASYIAIQLFEWHTFTGQFRAISEATALLGTRHFALLPARAFLYTFSALDLPLVIGDGKLRLSDHSLSLYQQLKAGLPHFKQAMKLFTKRRTVDDDSDSE